ncbi:hypothetical protein [Mycobacterium sp. NPDC006124]|uniref:hypothetical protein n=1 Tax=Mycobacterium sp. NPDC006124 TaxID=3156729 RepID=UPI0033A49097
MTKAFIDELHGLARAAGRLHLAAVVERLERPTSVVVTGRDGVGRGCVTTALRRRGIAVGDVEGGLDVCVVVIAEAVKAEDLSLIEEARRPVLVVLTKADLAGAGPAGPVEVARRRAAADARRLGVPVVPVVGLLAALGPTGAVEDDLVDALGRFVAEPPNLTGVDAFVGDPHSVDPDVRHRLLARLDRFGIAHAVLALQAGCDADRLVSQLARVANIDEVMTVLHAAAAPARYRRLRGAIAELHALASQFDDRALEELLIADVTAMAAMSAAVDVVTAAGVAVDAGDTVAAHRRRAMRWGAYARGPVTALHRQCSTDIVRGSLRLWDGGRA